MNHSLSRLLECVCAAPGMRGGTAMDVGAHHGESARYLVATGCFGKVVSFEPAADSFNRLLAEVSGTASCQFMAVNAALGGRSGVSDLHSDADTATASLLQYRQGYAHSGTPTARAVQVVTLDEYLAGNPVGGRLRLLKIDTQGNDLAVIEGGKQALGAQRPIIQTEFIHVPLYDGQCSPAELSKALGDMNYDMYSLNNLHVTAEGRLAFCDAIFIPREMEVPVTPRYTCIDDRVSLQTQIDTFSAICAERLTAINVLDAEVRRLRQIPRETGLLADLSRRLQSWVR